MIDQSSINLLDLVGANTNLKKVANTQGGEYHGPCPFCGGSDRFVVQPSYPGGGRWFCRQCTPSGQDAIGYWRLLHPHLSFREVCEQLGLRLDDATRNRQVAHLRTTPVRMRSNPSATVIPPPPAEAWQQAATTFFSACEDALWSNSGKAGLDYLTVRGLTNHRILQHAQIGYNPQWYKGRWGDKEVSLPRGIVIPWLIDGVLWGINIRDMDWKEGRGNKYKRATGTQNAIYRVHHITLNSTAVMVETELDALVIEQAVSGQNLPITTIATGSIGWGRPHSWMTRVAIAEQVLVAFDREREPEKIEAVEQAAAWWIKALKPRAKRILPTQHDITDMLLAGDDICAWIETAVQTQRN